MGYLRTPAVIAMAGTMLFNTSTARADTGYQEAMFADADGANVPVAIWYPSSATAKDVQIGLFRQTVARDGAIDVTHLPLVVVSHGNGSAKDQHYDTALALAHAGFVVAALEHPGDNYHDHSRASQITRRPTTLSRLIDFMTTAWSGSSRIDAKRIGAFGFSSGGFTVLAAAGGQPDLGRIAPHCAAHPKNYDCQLLANAPAEPGPAAAVVADKRIRALVVVAPALGFTFQGHLDRVKQPVQLWRADNDQILPAPDYADAVNAALPRRADFQTVPGAGHFDFLAPCSAPLRAVAPVICVSAPGFDRVAFHDQFNRKVTAFFARTLKR